MATTREKKIKGRKRHIVVDTLGLVIAADVHSASVQDRDGALPVLRQAKAKYRSIMRYFADQGYSGKLQTKCFLETKCLLSIVKRRNQDGFKVLPKRWIVERTFGWLNNYRRMSKDYEHSRLSSLNNIYINMIGIMLGRLAA